MSAAVLVLALLPGCSVLSPQAGASPSASAVASPLVGQQSGSPTPSPSGSASSSSPSSSSSTPEPSESGWAGVVRQVRDGVVRLQVAGCDGESAWMGSGFAVDDHLVMTAAHVVGDARTISIKSDQGITAATVIGYDYSTDSALLYTDSSFDGHEIDLSRSKLELGAELAVLGFPLGVNDLRIATGVVSGLDQPAEYDEFTVYHVFVTDAATNGGNSGGPVFNRAGEVIGLVSGGQDWDSMEDDRRPVEGVNFIVPADSLVDRLADWRSKEASDQDSCGGDEAPAEEDLHLAVDVTSEHPHASGIAQALYLHGESINTANYAAAWSVFTPSMQQRMTSLDSWQKGLASSYWTYLDVRKVTGNQNTARAEVDFRTQQLARDGHAGQTCSDWQMVYTMKRVDGVWLIDDARGPAPKAC